MDATTQRGLPASPDEESASVMMQQPAGGAGWKVDRVDIRPADNGGFIAHCSKSRPGASGADGGANVGPTASGSDYQSKEYAFGSLGEVVGFLEQEFGAGQASPEAGAPMAAPSGPPMTGY